MGGPRSPEPGDRPTANLGSPQLAEAMIVASLSVDQGIYHLGVSLQAEHSIRGLHRNSDTQQDPKTRKRRTRYAIYVGIWSQKSDKNLVFRIEVSGPR